MARPSTSSSPFPLQNLPKPTDTITYSIYPDSPTSLHSIHLQILSKIVPSLVPDTYIWQHDPFNLTPSISPVPHLHGSSKFGDNLDDEWLIAALLFRVSKEIPGVSISVSDSDGEFLLIEAAFCLPKWIRPDNSDNRVFLRGGRLHILPKSFESLDLNSALEILKSGKVDTLASDSVQAVIEKKINEYPERALKNMHRVRARVPVSVAKVLKEEPCLISLAVEGFYDRDVDSMKHAMKMERFLRKGEEDMVLISVTMSRAMYGQLIQQNFQAPKCYPMPLRNEVGYKEAELGMKIACGFEMMYQERKKEGEEGKGETWDVFLKSLEKSGVFDGLLVGSKEYKRVLDGAMEYYKKSSLFSRTRDILNAPVKRIDETLALPCSVSDFNCSELPSSDDDHWLYDGEDELNAAISERQKEMEVYESKHRKNQKAGAQKEKDIDVQSDEFDFKDVAESMQSFIQKLSSFEGAEVPQNRNSCDVELDVDQFFKDMESMLRPLQHDNSAHEKDHEEGSTSSSEMDLDEFEDGSDDAEHYGDGDTFMESYSDALNKELNATTLKRSFIRASEETSNKTEGLSEPPKGMEEEELAPVDVDVNLVKSLLDSYSSQEGLPGPASNLLGMMGLNLQPGANK